MQHKYPFPLRLIHWLMALIIISLIAVGLIMGNTPQGELRNQLYNLHKSFGVLVFILFWIRLFSRLNLGTPPLPEAIPKQERILAKLGHYGFYFFMVAMPVSGYLMTNSFGRGVYFFGAMLPKITGIDLEKGKFFAEIHGLFAYILIALIILHIAGVIKHLLKDKVNLLGRMV